MKAKLHIAESWPDKSTASPTPFREADIELTPKAAAKAANKLPRSEQLERFEQSLEARDNGNQPA